MAMYFYASKLSNCCRKTMLQKQRNMLNSNSKNSTYQNCANADIAKEGVQLNDNTIKTSFADNEKVIIGNSSDLPEVYCESSPNTFKQTSLGPGDIMWKLGTIISGPLDSLIDLLVPSKAEELDQEYIFSFLLSSRLFIRPFELLGKLLESLPEPAPMDGLVDLLTYWTKVFPYDFRDERIMNHVKHIVARCANTKIGDRVTDILSALLNLLTDLEHHEEKLRARHHQASVEKSEAIVWPCASQLAQILCHIERNLAKHVGPEEFLQCSGSIIKENRLQTNQDNYINKMASLMVSANAPLGVQDPKKTCNLESYLAWSARLRLLVANEILQCPHSNDRNKKLELWCGVAQYCLLVGNYNSATTILEALDAPYISRLQVTWSKLSSTTSQQIDFMQQHAEGCGNLWSQQIESKTAESSISLLALATTNKIATSQSIESNITASTTTVVGKNLHSSKASKTTTEWVAIPVFSDIVRLAVIAREECILKQPNGHINMEAFYRLGAICGAFTRHWTSDLNSNISSDISSYDYLCQYMQSCTLLSETDLMLVSFACEEPTKAEQELFDNIT